MDFIDRRLVRTGGESAVDQVGLNEVAYFGLEGFLLAPGARVEVDDLVGRVLRLLGPSKVLSRKKLKMIADRKDISFRMEMVNCRGVMAAGDESESAVLHQLKPTDGGVRVEGVNYGSSIVEKRTDESLECERQALLVMTKGSVREGAKNTKPRSCPPSNRRRMRGECEGRVEGDAQKFRVVCLRDVDAVERDRGKATKLLIPWSE